MAEANANKEKKHRAALKAAQKTRRLEKLDESIAKAKEAKMPGTVRIYTGAFSVNSTKGKMNVCYCYMI